MAKKEELNRLVTVEEAEATNLVVMGSRYIPFGHINDSWKRLLSKMEPGDELWEYCNAPHYWENLAGRQGIALVRNGEIIGELITKMN